MQKIKMTKNTRGTERRRSCRLCNKKATQQDMLPVGKIRFTLLHEHYPRELRNVMDWVHRTCLAALGLETIPEDNTCLPPLAQQVLRKRSASATLEEADWVNFLVTVGDGTPVSSTGVPPGQRGAAPGKASAH